MTCRLVCIFLLLAGFMCISVFTGCSTSPDKPTTEHNIQVIEEDANHRSPGAPSEPADGEVMRKFDLNHDNKPDVWAFYKDSGGGEPHQYLLENLIRKEWDFNFDGRVDIRRLYNSAGEIVQDQLDLDFDGKFDVRTRYQAGTKIKQEYDFNFDTKPDYWKFFEKNVIARTERDRDFNGRIDRWEYYREGQLDRIGLDEDGDGQIDKWIQEERD